MNNSSPNDFSSAVIRQRFIDYFKDLHHTYVPSAPLIPPDDPTLLFSNAGMNQFKDIFLGRGKRDYTRAVNSQKCMRVSGKHNDLEDVGVDTCHHTFFEMLGNWSFGDYYKEEAIEWAWKLLTKEWQIPPDLLWATVYRDDDEAAALWPKITGIPDSRVLRFAEKENFWEMAETGPCGPCSEIHIDLGEEHCSLREEEGHKCEVNGDCGRFMELWNLVFIQYNKNENGVLNELPQKHVDTGMGFERLVAILQGVTSNYDTDLFIPIIEATEELSGKKYHPNGRHGVAFRVIADHVRALSFSVADGAMPSNEGRGYVIRMILRRAVRYGRLLGLDEPFLFKLVPVLTGFMGNPYPELMEHREHVSRVILAEEERFQNTLTCGLELLGEIIARTKERGEECITGDDAFKLYDTYGFPLDLTRLIAREEGLRIDEEGVTAHMDEQKERARASWKNDAPTGIAAVYRHVVEKNGESVFTGYDNVAGNAMVTAIISEGKESTRLREGETGEVILNRTPFYAEAGGQVGDTGMLLNDHVTALVEGTYAPVEGMNAHRVKLLKGELETGMEVRAEVEHARRMETARSHTATHLLQNALRQVLGDHVKQAGSLVAPGRLRFDFTHFAAMTPREIERVEEIVNERVREGAEVATHETAYDDAREKGVIAIFGEKYGDRVRVVDIGGFSKELCGGTHVSAVGEIGLFKIVSESSVAAGIRRIEAVTGEAALHLFQKRERQIREIGHILKSDAEEVVDKVELLKKEHKKLKKAAGRRSEENATGDISALVEKAREVGSTRVIVEDLGELPIEGLRNVGDRIREKIKSGVILLGARAGEKLQLICMVTDDLVANGVHAGNLIKQVAELAGGRGGGRPQMAQAGGPDEKRLKEALEKAHAIIEQALPQ